jgi:thioredoxin 1
MSSVIIPESLEQLRAMLAADGKPTLVDFAASWCGPCKAMAPALEAFAEERKDSLNVVKVDVDEFHELAAEVGIRSVPTLLVVRNGQALAAKTGAQNKQALAQLVDSAVA